MTKFILRAFVLFLIGITFLLPRLSASQSPIWFADQVAVLMYHHVSDEEESSSTITTKLFREQLSYLKDKGYHFITLDEFHRFKAGEEVPNNAVLVTFDDGYESFYKKAYPILEDLNVPAVNFLITETLDHPDYNPYLSAIPFMSRDDVRTMMAESPIIEAACHTNGNHNKQGNNAFLTSKLVINNVLETDEQYKARILYDTQACLQQVSALTNKATTDLAYPFGISSRLARDLLKQCGVAYAYTILPEMTTRATDPMQIPRINGGSPFVSPKSLHQSIIRRAVTVHS